MLKQVQRKREYPSLKFKTENKNEFTKLCVTEDIHNDDRRLNIKSKVVLPSKIRGELRL